MLQHMVISALSFKNTFHSYYTIGEQIPGLIFQVEIKIIIMSFIL